jgi:hypothetical protein
MNYAGEVTISRPEKLQPGYVLFSAYAGEEFVLMDRRGLIVHRWPLGGPVKVGEMLPNGNLVYGRMRKGVFECDWKGRPLWHYPERQHHDFCRTPSGNTIILHHELVFNNRIWRGTNDMSDALTEVTRDGQIAWQWHLEQHVDELVEQAGIHLPSKQPDWAHTNTVEELPPNEIGKRDARFRAGNVLFSSRNIHTIGVIDRGTDRIVWTCGKGLFEGQHMPTMQPNGRILLFDNGTTRGFSRVIEIEPSACAVTWEFRLPDRSFARALSGQEALPNGNVLICSGNPGIITEVTRAREIVWEFHNKHIQGRREDYRLAVYRAAFCPAAWVDPRLQESPRR